MGWDYLTASESPRLRIDRVEQQLDMAELSRRIVSHQPQGDGEVINRQ